MYGLSAMTLADWDEMLASQPESINDRKKFVFHMKQGAEACKVLCDHVDACNDLKVVLLHYTAILQSYCGESGKRLSPRRIRFTY